jgi:hypothetical protein
MRRFVVRAIVLLCIAGSAKADPIPLSPELKAFFARPEQQQIVANAMAQQWRKIVENCPSPTLGPTSAVITAIAPTFDSSGTPVSGRWRVIDRVEGCGESRTLSVEYLFAPDGQMRRIATLPGYTIADLSLQRDALMYATMGMVRLTPSGCKDITYTDTKFIRFTDAASGSGRRPWIEEWTVRACGVTGIVTMHFTPDATGTSIATSVNETRQAGP